MKNLDVMVSQSGEVTKATIRNVRNIMFADAVRMIVKKFPLDNFEKTLLISLMRNSHYLKATTDTIRVTTRPLNDDVFSEAEGYLAAVLKAKRAYNKRVAKLTCEMCNRLGFLKRFPCVMQDNMSVEA